LMLISSGENEDDEELPKNQTPCLHQHINWKSISNFVGCD
jgi:hypothetical protein